MPVSRLRGPRPLSPSASSRPTSPAAGTESLVLDSECIPRERSSAPGFLGLGATDNTPARRLSNHDIIDDSFPRSKGCATYSVPRRLATNNADIVTLRKLRAQHMSSPRLGRLAAHQPLRERVRRRPPPNRLTPSPAAGACRGAVGAIADGVQRRGEQGSVGGIDGRHFRYTGHRVRAHGEV